MPMLCRDSNDYNSQGMPNNGVMHTTRVPPQMRPGLNHNSKAPYDYHHNNPNHPSTSTRDNSNNKSSSGRLLPQIEVNNQYKHNYPAMIQQTSASLKYPHTSTNSGSSATAVVSISNVDASSSH